MNIKGQVVLEYVLLIGIVTMALIYMGTDLKRALQSVVKVSADQLGSQANSEQDVELRTQTGFLVNAISTDKQTRQLTKSYSSGTENLIQNDTTQSFSKSISNLTFTSNST